MKKKVKTPARDVAGDGCGMGCLIVIVLLIILGLSEYLFGDWVNDLEDIWIFSGSLLIVIIGYGVYRLINHRYVKQEAEKKKASEEATKKEKKRIEDKLAKIKSDAGVEEETEEDQKKRYQKYLDSIKKRK